MINAEQAAREEFEWGELTWYASAQLGNSKALTLGQCQIKVGHQNHRHYHPNCEEVLHVIQGKIVHTIGDESIDMAAGDTIAIPANILHNARNVGDEVAIMTIVFSSAFRETIGE